MNEALRANETTEPSEQENVAGRNKYAREVVTPCIE